MAEGDRQGAGGLAEGSPVTEKGLSGAAPGAAAGREGLLCTALPRCAHAAPAEGRDNLGIARRVSVHSIK